jgi:hypothetical protein
VGGEIHDRYPLRPTGIQQSDARIHEAAVLDVGPVRWLFIHQLIVSCSVLNGGPEAM